MDRFCTEGWNFVPITQKVGSPLNLVQDELCRVLNGLQEMVALCCPKKHETFSFCAERVLRGQEEESHRSRLLVLTTEHEVPAGAAVETQRGHTSYA